MQKECKIESFPATDKEINLILEFILNDALELGVDELFNPSTEEIQGGRKQLEMDVISIVKVLVERAGNTKTFFNILIAVEMPLNDMLIANYKSGVIWYNRMFELADGEIQEVEDHEFLEAWN
jgi:hypothetical protein